MSDLRRPGLHVPYRLRQMACAARARSRRRDGSSGLSRFARRVTLAIVLPLALNAVLPAAAGAAETKYAAIVIDASTGRTLFARHADARRYPASLTKIMTLYIVFEELDAGRLRLDTPMSVSAHAAARPPSKIGFKPGQTIRADDAIKALVTKSANDVAVVIAEHIAGSETAFARRMTRTAREIGMRTTHFNNASGLPDDGQVTSARDMARLGIAIQTRFPRYYPFFKTSSFRYRGASYRNHNRLLGRVEGVDGIKTGYIRASGFNLVTSVRRDGRHIVAVVMGGRTGASRDAHMAELIADYLPKASRGGGIRVAALPPAVVPAPPRKPYAMVLTAVIERKLAAPTDTGTGSETEQRATIEAFINHFSFAALGADPARSSARSPAAQSRPLSDAVAANASVTADAPDAEAILIGAGTEQDIVLEVGSAEPSDQGDAADDPSSPPPGWHVQIAAAGTQAEAQDALDAMQHRFASLLSTREAFTLPVTTDGGTFYRARFGGFPDASQAWSVCNTLKQAGQGCWATAAESP